MSGKNIITNSVMKPKFVYTHEGAFVGYKARNEMGYSNVTLYISCNCGEKYNLIYPEEERVVLLQDVPVTYDSNKIMLRPILQVRQMYQCEFEAYLRNIKLQKSIDFEARPDKVASQLLTILN